MTDATSKLMVEIYRKGNPWQKERYAFMAGLNQGIGITRFGLSDRGTTYRHLLMEEDALHNYLGDPSTLDAVRTRFAGHKAGDLHRALTNTVASQPCCFNLFAPLARRPQLADALFSKLLGEALEVVHIEIEFTPNTWAGVPGFERTEDESIGDQSERGGTDADVAVFYRTSNGKRGVVLIEFKYIEAEFSTCGSYKSKTKGPRIRPGCNSAGWYAQRVAPYRENPTRQPDCGYLKYQNWRLLERSRVLNADAVKQQPGCPFKGSLNQLWRNLLLAERVADARQLDAFHFWVLSPAQNTFLWKESEGDVFQRMQELLTPFGKPLFRKLELDKDVIAGLDALAKTEEQREWLRRFRGRYLSSTPSAP